MLSLHTRKLKPFTQYIICTGLVLLTSLSCYAGSNILAYKTVALILLLSVSVLAMLFDIFPVLYAAVLSAFIWNFFFIPPVFTLHIAHTDDLLMFLLYFFIALINVVLSFKIRKEEHKSRDKEEKEKTIKLYNTLLNSLSHELRTPISTIIGAVDILKEHNHKISADNQKELLNQISIAGIRLNRQVENLLNMSRLETGMLKINRDWCDVNELVASVIEKFPEANQNHLQYEADEELPLFKFDRGLIEQVLHNLIDNAINYTPMGTPISVRVYKDGINCVFCVEDEGPGIPESEISLLFDKFYRLPQSRPGGTGLGLSIVKGFTEAHGGSVNAFNRPAGGLKFVVSFPAESSNLSI